MRYAFAMPYAMIDGPKWLNRWNEVNSLITFTKMRAKRNANRYGVGDRMGSSDSKFCNRERGTEVGTELGNSPATTNILD